MTQQKNIQKTPYRAMVQSFWQRPAGPVLGLAFVLGIVTLGAVATAGGLPEEMMAEPVLPEPVLPEPVLPEPVLSEPTFADPVFDDGIARKGYPIPPSQPTAPREPVVEAEPLFDYTPGEYAQESAANAPLLEQPNLGTAENIPPLQTGIFGAEDFSDVPDEQLLQSLLADIELAVADAPPAEVPAPNLPPAWDGATVQTIPAPPVVFEPAISDATLTQALAKPLVLPESPTPPAAPMVTEKPLEPWYIESPAGGLSEETKALLDRIPADGLPLVRPGFMPKHSVDIARTRATHPLPETISVEDFEQGASDVGLKIEVKEIDRTAFDLLQEAWRLMEQGQVNDAIAIYRRVREMEPHNNEALFGLAVAYHRKGQLNDARDAYIELILRDQEHHKALNNFLILATEEDPYQAEKRLLELAKTNPQFAPTFGQLGLVYIKLGNYEEAAKRFAQAVRMRPGTLIYRYHLARLLDHMNHRSAALKLYEQLLQAGRMGQTLPEPSRVLLRRAQSLAGRQILPEKTRAAQAQHAPSGITAQGSFNAGPAVELGRP